MSSCEPNGCGTKNSTLVSLKDYTLWDMMYFFTSTPLRYGQAFCNHFGIHDPNLFYCIDVAKCREIIYSTYLIQTNSGGYI